MKTDKSTKYLIKRVWQEYLKKHILNILIAFSFMVVYALCEAITIKLLEPVIDKIFVSKNTSLLLPLSIGMLVIFILKSFCDFGQARTISKIGLNVVADFRKNLFNHITNIDLAFFNKINTGQLLSRFSVDVNSISGVISNVITRCGKDIFSIIFLIGLMFFQDAYLATAVFCILPLAIYPIDKLGKSLRKLTKVNQEEMGNLNIQLKQVFQAIKEVKSYNTQKQEKNKTNSIIDITFNKSYKAAKTKAASPCVMEFLGGAAITCVILYGGHRVINGYITTGTFFSFIGALVAAARPIKAVGSLHVNLQEGLAGAERIFEILDTKRQVLESLTPQDFSKTNADIVFDNVHFYYPNTDVGVDDFSLKIPSGKTIALVGASGAGKSTLINLLLRFYDTQNGSIKISNATGDFIDIKDVLLNDLRDKISLVSQDVVLFDDTIANNISYGSKGSDIEEIIKAAKAANADEFINKLPNGYETIVGERGSKLSGGQKQRISIARAMLKNAPILLLDEATSALDTKAEEKVQKAIENLMKNKTSIVIAHRLSTIQNADEIIVMENGKIIEKGNHKKLIQNNGSYAQLYKLQFEKEK